MNPLLSVEDAHVSYRASGRGRVAAVRGVSLTLAAGEVLGLVGESGCGKSTLAKAVTGMVPLEHGVIRHNGDPVRQLGYRRRRARELGIQMVFQNPYASLNPRRRIGDQIGDGLRAAAKPSWNVNDLLEAVGLDAAATARYPHAFSGGQRQRIAIARALAAEPDVLIGDEPIASLDASLQSRIATLLRELALRQRAGLLFISHDLAIVRVIADRVAVMRAGRIVEEGPTDSVWSNPSEDYTRRLIGSVPRVDGLGVLPG